jgi:hypothetical protein
MMNNTISLTFWAIVDDGEDIDKNGYPIEEG